MNKTNERMKNRQLRRQATKFVQERLFDPKIAELTANPIRKSPHLVAESSESDVVFKSVINWDSVRNGSLSNSDHVPYEVVHHRMKALKKMVYLIFEQRYKNGQ